MSFKNLLKVMLLFTFFTFFIAGCSNNDTQSTADIEVETDENINDVDTPSAGADEQTDNSIELNEIEDDVELGELIS